jgi:hypothetical protein
MSRAGLILAHHLALAYQDNPKLATAMVGGSVSRGYADEYSDLEIGIFWTEEPTEDERTAAARQIRADILSLRTAEESEPAWWGNEHYGVEAVVIDGRPYTGSLMVSIHHLLAESVELWLADVLDHYDTSIQKQELVAAIHDAAPLVHEELLRTWQRRTSAYPPELARRIIRENLWFGPWFWPGAYAQRGDDLVLHQHLIWIAQSMLKLLAALNRMYYRSTEHKWMDQLIREMAIAPVDLAARIKQALRAVPAEAEHQLHQLIDETLALVEQHMPEVDASFEGDERPWVNLAWARDRWKLHAPYSLLQKIEP